MRLNKYAYELIMRACIDRRDIVTSAPRSIVRAAFQADGVAAAESGVVPYRPWRWAGIEGASDAATRQRLRRAMDAIESNKLGYREVGDTFRLTAAGIKLGESLAADPPAIPEPDASQHTATRGVPEPRNLRAVERGLVEGAVADLRDVLTADPRSVLDSYLDDEVVRAALTWRCVPYAPGRWLQDIDGATYPRHKMDDGTDLYATFEDQVDHDLRLLEYWGLLRRRDLRGYDERENNLTHVPLVEVLPAAWAACGLEPPESEALGILSHGKRIA